MNFGRRSEKQYIIFFIKYFFENSTGFDFDQSRFRSITILIKLDFEKTRSGDIAMFTIDAKTMFFGISAQNDAEWWSSCRNWIDF